MMSAKQQGATMKGIKATLAALGAMLTFNIVLGMIGFNQSDPWVFLAGIGVAIGVARHVVRRPDLPPSSS
jgi:hypothetical protein